MRNLFWYTALAVALSACASMKRTRIEKAEVAKAKNVAIAGFHLAVEEPKSLIGDFKKAKDALNGKFKDANQEHETADRIYDDLNSRLSKEMKWNMKPRAAVAGNSGYKQLVTKYTTGLQVGGMTTSENYQKMRPHAMLDADPVIYKLSQADREALMDQLGVDALVANFMIASLRNESTFGGMVGAAKYKPKTQNVLRLYIRGQKEPVWLDSWAWGDGDKALQATANFVEDNLILEQVVVASKRSFDKLFENYRKYE